MEKLSVEKRTEVSKMSTERLRVKLTKAGYDEDDVFEIDRSALLSTYAEYLLSPPIPESPEKAEGGMSAEELELRRKQEFEYQKETQEKEDVRGGVKTFERWSYRGRELKMRRRGSGKSPWRDKLVFTGRH